MSKVATFQNSCRRSKTEQLARAQDELRREQVEHPVPVLDKVKQDTTRQRMPDQVSIVHLTCAHMLTNSESARDDNNNNLYSAIYPKI